MKHRSLCVARAAGRHPLAAVGRMPKIMKREVFRMNFGQALEQVKQGKGMRLPQWKEDVVLGRTQQDDGSLSVCGKPVRACAVERDHD